MNTKKIIVNGKEVEIYTEISQDEIEDNRDLLNNNLLEDTIELDKTVREIISGEINEWYKKNWRFFKYHKRVC